MDNYDGFDDIGDDAPSVEEVTKHSNSSSLAETDMSFALASISEDQNKKTAVVIGSAAKLVAKVDIDKPNTLIAYTEKSRSHWVTVSVTNENDQMNIELIDSKGGAKKRPEEEYSKNPIKRAGQKLLDIAGGIIDSAKATIVGKAELSEIKTEMQKKFPNKKISTTLTKLKTQRDDTHCGRHTINNIEALASGNKPVTDINKANATLKQANKRIESGKEQSHNNSPSLEQRSSANLSPDQTPSSKSQNQGKGR